MTPDPNETESTKAVKPKAKKTKSAEETSENQPAVTKAAKKKAAPKAIPVEETSGAEAAPEKPAAKKKEAKKVSAKKEEAPEPVVEVPAAVIAAEPVAEEPVVTKAAAKKKAVKKVAAEPEAEEEAVKAPEPKLERLQKILARAGISSRRKAEELILGGQVQINGKIVTELGSKADPARDHVRVDGKLLQGPERIRYFVLNKPKGFVTTVSDPEGRPTVMQFFERENERLYPVGRLDYLSEGLLLVTNDGDLANKLTKASSGVEKTYLVKVAGQPTEDMLDVLRAGVVIEKGRPGTGSGRVRTAPAQIRQVRQGDNPWYEVIIIEGRNRELRKMFEEIGHHVEKIRRVGYGPLVLDLEPGKLRELEPEEVQQLRLAAAGKLKNRRRRGPAPAQLPRDAGKTVRFKKADGKPGYEKLETYGIPVKDRPRPAFDRLARPPAGSPAAGNPGFDRPRPQASGPSTSGTARSGFSKPAFDKPAFSKPGFKAKPRSSEPTVTDYVVPRKPVPEFDESSESGKGAFNPDYKPGFRTGSKPGFSAGGPPKRFGAGGGRGARPGFDREKPYRDRNGGGPRSERPAPYRAAPQSNEDFTPTEPRKPSRIGIEPVTERPRDSRPDRPTRPTGGKSFGKPFQSRSDRSEGFSSGNKSFRPAAGPFEGGRPTGTRPPSGDRPFRPRTERPDGAARPFRPRTDGPPSGERPFRPRIDRPTSDSRPPFRPRTDRPGTPSGDRSSFSRNATGLGRSTPRADGPPARRAKSFEGGSDAPREFRPRESKSFSGPGKFGGPKKFGAAKSFGARSFDGPKPPGGSNSKPSNKLGPDGQPRIKVRARNSFTGKNKGRPKPKPKSEE